MLRNRQLAGGLIDVLLPVPRAGGLLLRRPALPVGLPRASRRSRPGARLLPLSITLLAAAIGVPAALPARLAAPRRARAVSSRCSPAPSSCSALSTRTPGRRSSSSRCSSIGLGIGALASQLGAVTVSAVPDDESPEVGGVQNTVTNLGASLGTALAGSLLIATLTTSLRHEHRSTTRRSRHASSRRPQVAARGRRAVHLRRRPRSRRSTKPA